MNRIPEAVVKVVQPLLLTDALRRWSLHGGYVRHTVFVELACRLFLCAVSRRAKHHLVNMKGTDTISVKNLHVSLFSLAIRRSGSAVKAAGP